MASSGSSHPNPPMTAFLQGKVAALAGVGSIDKTEFNQKVAEIAAKWASNNAEQQNPDGPEGSMHGNAILSSVDVERCLRQPICRILIKCADINNPTRPWELCKEWAYRIVEEYFNQTAEERAKGLPLTMEVFDRDTCNVPLTQSRFIDMFARDLFEGWCRFSDMSELMNNLESNYQNWQEEARVWPQQRHQEFGRFSKSSMESLNTTSTQMQECSVEPIPETPLLCQE